MRIQAAQARLPLGLPPRGKPMAVPTRERQESGAMYAAVMILRRRGISVWRISDHVHLVGRERLNTRQLISKARRIETRKPKEPIWQGS